MLISIHQYHSWNGGRRGRDRMVWWLMPFSTIFQLSIVVVSFIGGGNQSTRRKPLTCRKSLTNFIHLAWYYFIYFLCFFLE
jgi:hypothetical protein